MRILVTLLMSLGLLTPMVLSTASAATPGTLVIQAPANAPADSIIVITGRYSAATADLSGYTVHLEYDTGGEWIRLASVLTDANGAVQYEVTNSEDSTYRLVFDGEGELDPVVSDTVLVKVQGAKARLTLSYKPSSPLKLRTVTLTARLTSNNVAQPNQRVVFKAAANGDEQAWGSALTNSNGVAVLKHVVGRTGVKVSATSTATGKLQSAYSGLVRVDPRSHEVRLTWTAPRSVVDERSVKFRLEAKTRDGQVIPNALVKLYRSDVKRAVDSARTNSKGIVVFRQTPRTTASWYVQIVSTNFTKSATSAKRIVRNVPPGKPVILPGPAPRIKLPAQPRATTPGANVRITPIPDSVWASMQGKSWRSGCMARSSLRYVRVNYWAFDGYRRQGELIIAASASSDYRRALESFYRNGIPIRHMYRVDRFGYSSVLNGADDYKSMAADNTSAYNCREVVGRPGVRSPHSTGRSFDINPWENPYASSAGWTPNTYWVGRSHPRVAWRSSSHQVVQLLRAAGFSWTYGVRDAHHFDA